MEWWKEPIIQIGIPVVMSQITMIVVLVFGFLNQNKRLDDVVRRLDRIETRLDSIEGRLATLEKKVEGLEIKAWR